MNFGPKPKVSTTAPNWRTVAALACFALLSASCAGQGSTHDHSAGSQNTTSRPRQEANTPTTWEALTQTGPSSGVGYTVTGVSCPSDVLCVASGFSEQHRSALHDEYENGAVGPTRPVIWTVHLTERPLVERTNLPQSGEALLAISCSDSSSCVAVGSRWTDGSTSPASWELVGGSWREVEPQEPATIGSSSSSYLTGVSCWASGSCTATGGTAFFSQPGGGTASHLPIVEDLSHGTWSLQTNPASVRDAQVEAIACAKGTPCTIAGWAIAGIPTHDGLEAGGGFLGRSSAGSWSVVKSGEPTSILGLSCPSGTPCLFVGRTFDDTRGGYVASAMLGDRPLDVLLDTRGGDRSQLLGTSCAPPGRCVMVGFSSPGNGSTLGSVKPVLIVTGRGTPRSTPPQMLTSGRGAQATAVSCSIGGRCLVVGVQQGDSIAGDGIGLPLFMLGHI